VNSSILIASFDTKAMLLFGLGTPEYAVWVKSRDELMNDPVLVVGQKPDMEKAFGNKISQQPENCENCNDPVLVQAFLKKWWVESDLKVPNLPLSLRLNFV
jgi:hypothetical protein